MRLILTATLLLVAGCATGYQSKGLTGGYSETQLSENTFRVSFRGNGYTSAERAYDLAMLRSAELTSKNGFKFFAFADSQQTTSRSSYTTPTQSVTTGQATVVGNTAYGTAQTTAYGGDTVFISKPRSTNLVIMFHERPEGVGMIYEATFICRSIGAKYKVSC